MPPTSMGYRYASPYHACFLADSQGRLWCHPADQVCCLPPHTCHTYCFFFADSASDAAQTRAAAYTNGLPMETLALAVLASPAAAAAAPARGGEGAGGGGGGGGGSTARSAVVLMTPTPLPLLPAATAAVTMGGDVTGDTAAAGLLGTVVPVADATACLLPAAGFDAGTASFWGAAGTGAAAGAGGFCSSAAWNFWPGSTRFVAFSHCCCNQLRATPGRECGRGHRAGGGNKEGRGGEGAGKLTKGGGRRRWRDGGGGG